jgi:hypothetical protein
MDSNHFSSIRTAIASNNLTILHWILLLSVIVYTLYLLRQWVNRRAIAQRRLETQYAREYEAAGSSLKNHARILELGKLRGLSDIQLGALDARLLGQVKMATEQAVISRRRTMLFGGVALIMPTIAAFASAVAGTFPAGWQTNALLFVSGLNAIMSVCQIILTLQGWQKIWFESRKTTQLVMSEIYAFLESADPYDDHDVNTGWRICFERCQGHIARSQQSILQLIEAGARAEEAVKAKEKERAAAAEEEEVVIQEASPDRPSQQQRSGEPGMERPSLPPADQPRIEEKGDRETKA